MSDAVDLIEQHVVVYENEEGEAVVYATVYTHQQEAEARRACRERHPGCTVRALAAASHKRRPQS